MTSETQAAACSQEHEHGLSARTCVIVWIGLLILTTVTVAVSEIDFTYFHILVAMIVATAKAALVVLWFMHVKYEGRAIHIMVFLAFFLLAIFISFTFFDLAYRPVQVG